MKRRLKENGLSLAADFGLERLLFITITFPRPVTDFRYASRVLNKLSARVFVDYGPRIVVLEPFESGAMHYHILTVADRDVRTGYQILPNAANELRTGNAALTAELARWRAIKKQYGGIGRVQIEPVNDILALSIYLGKYLEIWYPHLKGCRRVNYSRHFWPFSGKFSWAKGKSREFRHFCQSVFGDHEQALLRYGEELYRQAWRMWRARQNSSVSLC